ncbi:uncharacterized protein LOC116426939 [Nomia melanderi]|uniref:uncharacterized protein LOC116426939 n=1 Tax=Nomia melanderi TaxID=2448451 RepID=UPI0013047059|nr:uncharacterized protein LOC116426939 [Nomia melanderi]XP_031832510.1 uncharacterized protein LOC116426939 [Nomia melanderi]XP_031832511.1 uncharacterized protein LOC116426939 [Nomia melanderi]
MKAAKHIDDVQPPTVEEHLKLISEDKSPTETEFIEITPKDLPEWFDEKLYKKAQQFYFNNMLAFAVAQTSGLMVILSVPDIIEVLEYTKRSDTVCLSFKRYAETLLLIYEFFRCDILDPNSSWYKAMNMIRWRHVTTSRRRVKQGLNAIYQKDMAITQFGFMGYILTCPDRVGLAHASKEDMIAFNHFWRVTGHLLGISDRFNIARKTPAETRELCKGIIENILIENLNNPSEGFIKLASNAVDGFFYIDVNLNKDAFYRLMYEMSGLKYPKPIGWYATFNYYQRECFLYLCNVPYIGTVVRVGFNYFLLAMIWLLRNYPIFAWMTFGKEKSRYCVYEKIK